MVVLGTDVHERSHTFVAVDERGRKIGEKVVSATTEGHLAALAWAMTAFGEDLLWVIEDCRNLSARLERDLLSADQKVLRVAPKLMALQRASARTRGKSDPIDAAVAQPAASNGASLESSTTAYTPTNSCEITHPNPPLLDIGAILAERWGHGALRALRP